MSANRRSACGGSGGWRVALVVAGGVAVLGASSAGPAPPRPDLSETSWSGVARADTGEILHLLSRTTYGARPADLDRVAEIGPHAWLEEQLHPERIDDSALEARLRAFPAATLDQAELYRRYPPPQLLRARLERDIEPDSLSPEELQRELRQARSALRLQPPGRILFDLAGAKLVRAVHSERQLEEVMTDFWFNHFNVFFAKGADRWLVSDYEREAIRPHVFSRFEDLLVATASHPAMLVYLDNWQNVAPDSVRPPDPRRDRARAWRDATPAERRGYLERRGLSSAEIAQVEEAVRRVAGRTGGINENYARELLELHTLGVDGGYTQEDVVEVARVFTGWTITRPGEARLRALLAPGTPRRLTGRRAADEAGPGGRAMSPELAEATEIHFRFRPELHDPGPKSVLGMRLAGGGMEDGLELLAALAAHPSTARHIATKLAAAFAADDPPEALVDELTRTFLDTDGDLREVTRALFTSEHFLDPARHGAKLKSPFELVASALRTTRVEVRPAPRLLEQLRAMGHLPYMSNAPTGYPESAEEWTSSGAVLQRLEFGLALAEGRLLGPARPAAPALTDGNVTALVAALLPGIEAPELEATIEADLAAHPASRHEARQARAMGLILGSPQFQRH